MVKNRLQCKKHGFNPWVRKIPWRRKWQPTSVFLPGEFHGQRSLVGYSPWGYRESDTTEWLTLSLFSWRKKGEMTTWWKSKREVAQSFPTLCNPMDCSPPGSSVHGILQARILEWVAISFSRESSRPRDWIQVSRIAGRCFNLWATREAHYIIWMMSSQIFCVS